MGDDLKTFLDNREKEKSSSVVPTVSDGTLPSREHHERMGVALTHAIREGKGEVPESPPPLVCKPKRVESWRIFKIMSEFVEGFELLSKYSTAATIFGSTRQEFEDGFYRAATELSHRLSKKGFAIITGGSSGIMEAANRGAFEAGGASIGINIRLENDQPENSYTTDHVSLDHFFVRKTMLSFASEVYIFFPGGFGTLDEFFEILTLVQTKKIRRIPIVLYGSEYWNPLIEFFKTKLYSEHRAIDESDMDLFWIVDSVDEAYEYIVAHVEC